MRHRIAGKTLSRTTDHRKALRRNLAAALFEHGRIKTTLVKAKYIRRFVERIITVARKGVLNARRRVISMLQNRFLIDQEETDVVRNKSFKVVKGPMLIRKIFDEIAPRYAERSGGYTRIIRLGKPRLGDNTEQVYLELIDPEQEKQSRRTRTGGDRRRKAQIRYQAAAAVGKPAKSGTEQRGKQVDNTEQEESPEESSPEPSAEAPRPQETPQDQDDSEQRPEQKEED